LCLFQGLVQVREDGDEAVEAGDSEDAEHGGAGGNDQQQLGILCHRVAMGPG
jgi:hypothetical protein